MSNRERAKFYFKKEDFRDKKVRVRLWVEQDNGFVGLADETIREGFAVEFARFEAEAKEYGWDKAIEYARKHGEWRASEELRTVRDVERDIESTQEKLSKLETEYKNAKKLKVKREKENEKKKSGEPVVDEPKENLDSEETETKESEEEKK